MRAGRNKIARTSAKMASNDRATARNGKDRSHTKGQRMMARIATGQHSTNRTHHKSKVFTSRPSSILQATLSYSVLGVIGSRREALRAQQFHLHFGIDGGSEPVLGIQAVRILGA
jgi:hypothetical protein